MTARSTKAAFFHCPFKITVKDLPFIVNQKKRYFRNRKKMKWTPIHFDTLPAKPI